VNCGDDLSAFADGAADALDGSSSDVADREDAGNVGFERTRTPSGHHEATSVARDITFREPGGRRIGADEEKDISNGCGRFDTGATKPNTL